MKWLLSQRWPSCAVACQIQGAHSNMHALCVCLQHWRAVSCRPSHLARSRLLPRAVCPHVIQQAGAVQEIRLAQAHTPLLHLGKHLWKQPSLQHCPAACLFRCMRHSDASAGRPSRPRRQETWGQCRGVHGHDHVWSLQVPAVQPHSPRRRPGRPCGQAARSIGNSLSGTSWCMETMRRAALRCARRAPPAAQPSLDSCLLCLRGWPGMHGRWGTSRQALEAPRPLLWCTPLCHAGAGLLQGTCNAACEGGQQTRSADHLLLPARCPGLRSEHGCLLTRLAACQSPVYPKVCWVLRQLQQCLGLFRPWAGHELVAQARHPSHLPTCRHRQR